MYWSLGPFVFPSSCLRHADSYHNARKNSGTDYVKPSRIPLACKRCQPSSDGVSTSGGRQRQSVPRAPEESEWFMALVVATDFSEEAQRAGTVAAAIASRLQETLRLVHVSGDPRAPAFVGKPGEVLLVSELKALSDEAAALRASSGVPVEEELCAGPIADAIASAAERVVATAIVVAGRRRWAPRLGRGTIERLVRQVRLPVLVLRAPERLEPWLKGERKLRVMVGSDLGAASTRALRFAGRELAGIGPVDMTVVCVAAPDETSIRLGLPMPTGGAALLPEAEVTLRSQLDAQVQSAGVSAPVRVLVRAGTAAPETHLSVLAENEAADVLVVGTRRHSWIEEIWYRSVSRGVLRAASTNVICVPRLLIEDKPGMPAAPRVIVVPTDLSPLGDAAVPVAYGLITSGGTVHLLHVVSWASRARPGERASDPELTRRLAERIPAEASSKNVRTECHLIVGNAAEEILALAERVEANAICVGSHGRSGVGAAVLGSVAQEVISKSRWPVTVVTQPRE